MNGARGQSRALAGGLAALLLAGCAQLPRGTDGLSFEERRARLDAVDAWTASGSIAVDDGERGFQGRFVWRQDGEHTTLDIRGPLRQSILNVSGTPQKLMFVARGEERELIDPEVELSALLGWWLPVTSVDDWLLGLPDPAFPVVSARGVDGTLAALDQRLWNVRYRDYQLAPAPAGNALIPHAIELAHGDLEMVVTLLDWAPLAD